MRILFTTTPTFSHTTPMVPLAQAARIAGHEVLFAGGGITLKTAAGAGIPVLDAAPGQDITEPHRRFIADPRIREMSQEEGVAAFIGVMAEIGQMMLPTLVQAARDWEADAVVTPAWMPWGLLAARSAGALGVLHGIGLRYPVVPWMATDPPEVVRRHGVTEFPEHCDAEISLSPASLERFNPIAPGEVPFPVLSMRPCTYNGAGEVPLWALGRADRPRVAVSMGTTTNEASWPQVLRAIVDGTEDLDAEIVLATGGVDVTSIVKTLPERVRVVDFVPLSSLLSRCDALVHHSGMNSMFSSLAAGVPQVALAGNDGDSPLNGHVLRSRGAGITLDRAEAGADSVGKAVRDVLQEPSYRSAGQEVAAEMAAMPAPHEVVAQLAELAESRSR
ncbi:glycosyltransferase [Streptomyces sp. T-3]|nr:glycosyltransferase [Streptomyces sp. T-3]